jgi:hypothetical protein
MKSPDELLREGRKRILTLRLPMVMPLLPRDCIVYSSGFDKLLLLSETFSPVPEGAIIPEYAVATDLAPGAGHWARDPDPLEVERIAGKIAAEHRVVQIKIENREAELREAGGRIIAGLNRINAVAALSVEAAQKLADEAERNLLSEGYSPQYDAAGTFIGSKIMRESVRCYPAARPGERSVRHYPIIRTVDGVVFKAEFFLPAADNEATPPQAAICFPPGFTVTLQPAAPTPNLDFVAWSEGSNDLPVGAVAPENRPDCPDCYIGLSGQVERCERHRG